MQNDGINEKLAIGLLRIVRQNYLIDTNKSNQKITTITVEVNNDLYVNGQ